MKVLICDDEMFIRASLKSMLLELPYELELIGEAKNGIEALSLIEEHLPHIVFIDIRMPKLNGLDTISAAKEKYPDIYFVILSGFSEFEYARQAIQLGILEYLLKPVSPDALKKVFDKIIPDYSQKVASSNASFNQAVLAYYHGSLPCKEKPSKLSSLNFLSLIYTIDFSHSVLKEEEKLDNIQKEIEAYLDAQHSLAIKSCMFPLDRGSYGVVLGFPGTSSTLEDAFKFFETFNTWLHTLSCDDYMLTSISSPLQKDLQEVRFFLDTYFNLLPSHYFLGIGKAYLSSHFKALQAPTTFAKLGKYFKVLSITTKNNNLLLLNKHLKLLTSKENLDFLKAYPKVHPVLSESIFFVLGYTLDYSLDTWPDELKSNLEHQGYSIIKTNKYIEEIKVYIHTYYMEDIGINFISSKLHVTPNYLSALFHKTTGIKFSQFVKQVRIEKAKELLITTDLSIKEIAERVGYFSVRHFSKTFTELMSMYPSDYRKQNM